MHYCNNNIGFLIKQISERMQAEADARMRDSDLTYSQFHVLGYLAHHDQEASQKEIEEFLGVSHPTVVGLVGRLERKGFVTSRTDEQDRRTKRIRMTDKALALGDQMKNDWERGERELRRNMTEAEAEELLRLLRIVNENICHLEGGSI